MRQTGAALSIEVLHSVTPTSRPRHTLTETDSLAEALEQAANRWPEDAHSRSRLLLRLIETGREALYEETAHRRSAIRRTAGGLSGIYPQGYLDDLRRAWPE